METSKVLTYAWGAARLPGSLAYLTIRLLNKKETLGTALQRLGWSSIERRNGPVLWFNVNAIGETSTVLPVVYRCLQEYNEKVTVLVTTPCLEVYKLLGDHLPQRVLVQLMPLANPVTITAFLRKWQPQIGVFLETPFQRELSIMARDAGVRLALLNAHMPGDDMLEWHARRTSRDKLRQTLSSYSLIVPRTYADVGRFRMFGATLGQMPGWSTDLQQASELGACASRLLSHRSKIRRPLLRRLGERQLWIAANTLPGEEVVVARIHAVLRGRHKGLLTLVAPRVAPLPGAAAASGGGNSSIGSDGSATYSAAAQRISADRRLQVELLSAAVQAPERLSANVDVLVLDDPDALISLYSLSEIVLVGGSLLPSRDGASSPAAAAVAGCALLMGAHGAEFLGMAADLNHAAILASEEVAAAVAQTGATMRGIQPGGGGGYHTPRESQGQDRAGGPDGTQRGSAVQGDAPGSAGPSWQQLVAGAQQPMRTVRPMSAPPAMPEHFQLRLEPAAYAFSPLGGVSLESSFQLGSSNGLRGFFIAPFSTPGVTRSFGGAAVSSPVASCVRGTEAHFPCSDFTTAASAVTDSAATSGGGRGRRRDIDRFRWASGRDVVGFGYTIESEAEDSDSTSSTCNSEEELEQQQPEEGEDCRPEGPEETACDDRKKRIGVIADAAAKLGSVCGDAVVGPPSAGSQGDTDKAEYSSAGGLPRVASGTAPPTASVPPPPSPPQPASLQGMDSDTADYSFFTRPLAIAYGPAAEACWASSRDEDDTSSDGNFHDAFEDEDNEEALRRPAPVLAQAVGGAVNVGAGAEVRMQATRGQEASTADALDAPRQKAEETYAGSAAGLVTIVRDDKDYCSAAATATASTALGIAAAAAYIPASIDADLQAGTSGCAEAAPTAAEDASVSGDGGRPQVGAERRVPRPSRAVSAVGGGSECGVAGFPGCGKGDHGDRSGGSDAPHLRGNRKDHLIICKDLDANADGQEVGGPELGGVLPRQGFCSARAMSSDLGLPTAAPQPQPANGSAPRESLLSASPFFVATAAAATAAASLASGTQASSEANSGEDRGSDDGDDDDGADDSSAVAGLGVVDPERRQGANAAASVPLSMKPLLLSVAAAEESALCETWASDVSMAAMVEDDQDTPGVMSLEEKAAAAPSSQPSGAIVSREALCAWAPDSPSVGVGGLSSFRGSSDHSTPEAHQQSLSSSSTTSAVRGRAGRGGAASLTRLSGRAPATVGSITNLVGLAAVAAAEGEELDAVGATEADAASACGALAQDAGGGGACSAAAPAGGGGSNGSEVSATMLPLPPAINPDAKEGDDDACIEMFEQSPTVVPDVLIPLDEDGDGDKELKDSLMGSSPTTIAPAAGATSGGAHRPAAMVSFVLRGGLDVHSPRASAVDSPKSDFEFGGSVPDDAGSGSPTLLASASVHNGSGGNLQTYAAADGSEQQQQADGMYALAASSSHASGARPNSRTSSPSSTKSWSDAAAASPHRQHHLAVGPVPPRFHGPRQPSPLKPGAASFSPQERSSMSSSSSSPYDIGSCFAGQTSFAWLTDAASAVSASAAAAVAASVGSGCACSSGSGSVSGSSGVAGPVTAAAALATAATDAGILAEGCNNAAPRGSYLSPSVSSVSIGSCHSVEVPQVHQVASIGSWLDHFGSMLPQPSLGLQLSQVQHDPMVWFAQQQRNAAGLGFGGSAGGVASGPGPVVLQGVASGLRAPMHSPLRAFEDDRRLGFNAQALASVTTTLFPSAHAGMGTGAYPAPLPPPVGAIGAAVPASPRMSHLQQQQQGLRMAGGAAAAAGPSSPLRSVSSISMEQVTSALTVGRSQYIGPAAAAMASGPAVAAAGAFANPQYGFAAGEPPPPAATNGASAARDELSALLNSPRSPVSPVRVARVVSPASEHRAAAQQTAAAAAGPLLASPAWAAQGIPGLLQYQPMSPGAAVFASPTRRQHQHQQEPQARVSAPGGRGGGARTDQGALPLPMSLPAIQTPRRELQSRQSAPTDRASPLTSPPPPPPPLPSAHSIVAAGGSGWSPSVSSPGRGGNRILCVAGRAPAAAMQDGPLPPDSPRSSGTSSCPNTPTSRAADMASSPFRNPRDVQHSSVHSPLVNPVAGVAAEGQAKFEAAFEAAVRAGSARSPARSVAAGGRSTHVSPCSSPYRSPFVAAMAAVAAPSPYGLGPGGTAFRSLFLEEEEEELAAGRGGLVDANAEEVEEDEERCMPLSPRAGSHNVLFSMQDPHDDEHIVPPPRASAAAAFGATRTAVFSNLALGVRPVAVNAFLPLGLEPPQQQQVAAPVPAPDSFLQPPPQPQPRGSSSLPSAASASAALPPTFTAGAHTSPIRPRTCFRSGSGVAVATAPPLVSAAAACSLFSIPDRTTCQVGPTATGTATKPVSPISSGVAGLVTANGPGMPSNGAVAAAPGVAAAEALAVAVAAAVDSNTGVHNSSGGSGEGGGSVLGELDKAPTFSRFPSLSATDEDGDDSGSPARAFPHVAEARTGTGRQPRITLSGGPLVVPAIEGEDEDDVGGSFVEGGSGIGGSCLLPMTNLSQSSCTVRLEDTESEAEASMELPAIAPVDGGGAADESEGETPRPIPQQQQQQHARSPVASPRENSTSGIANSTRGSPSGGSSGSRSANAAVAASAVADYSGSLVAAGPGPASPSSAAAAVDRQDSPPRSPAERTSCPRSSCPNASPVKPPLHLSPQLPRCFPTEGAATSPLLPYMPVLPLASSTSSSQLLSQDARWNTDSGNNNRPQSPSSPPLLSPRASMSFGGAAQPPLSPPPASYMTPCATDPRASPVKVKTVAKRTPADVLSPVAGPMECAAPRPLQFQRSLNVAAAPMGSSVANTAAGFAASILGFNAANGGPLPDGSLIPGLPSFTGMAPLRTQPVASAATSPGAAVAAAGPGPASAVSQCHYAHALRASPPRQLWNAAVGRFGAPGGGGGYDGGDNEEPLLSMRASAPAGFAALADRGLPPTPRSGRRGDDAVSVPSAVNSPATTASENRGGGSAHEQQQHPLDLHAQRNQQQQMWDRARAESRNASAAGTPRSARTLFAADGASGGGLPPLSASVYTTSGFMDHVCVSPVDAPRSPRAGGASPARAPTFALDAAAMLAGGGPGLSVGRGDAAAGIDDESAWQAQLLRYAAGAQGTPRSARVLFPPASPRSDIGSAGVGADQLAWSGAGVEPASPSWSHISRRLFPEDGGVSRFGAAGSTAGTAGTMTPERQSPDRLDEIMANMRVQVASPVSPQPRRPPPPASPLMSTAASMPCAAVTAAAAGATAALSTSTGGRRGGSSAPQRRPSSPLLQTTLLQQARKTSVSGEQHGVPPQSPSRLLSPQRCGGIAPAPAQVAGTFDAARSWFSGGGAGGPPPLRGGPAAFRSPGAAPTMHLGQQQHPGFFSSIGGGGNSGGHGQAVPVLPHLPPLPPLPRLRQLSSLLASHAVPAFDAAFSTQPSGWPPASAFPAAGADAASELAQPAGGFVAGEAGAYNPPVDAVRRLLFRQSAPQLLQEPLLLGPIGSDGGCSSGGGVSVPVGSMPLPALPSPAAEKDALAALESQFKAAEREAAGLPIETRVATPSALAATATSAAANIATGCQSRSEGPGAMGPVWGPPVPFSASAAAASQSDRPSIAPIQPQHSAARPVAPPSPRAASGAAQALALPESGVPPGGSRHSASGMNSVDADPRAPSGTGGGELVGVKPKALQAEMVSAPTAVVVSGRGTQHGSTAAAAAVSSAAAAAPAGFKPVATSAAAAAAPEQGPSIMRPTLGSHAAVPAAAETAESGLARQQELAHAAVAGDAVDQCVGEPASAPSPALQQQQQEQQQRSARSLEVAAPGRGAGARGSAVGGAASGSPWGLTGGGLSADRELPAPPCARYAGQFLIPAAQVTCDPRMGPAVWMVSSEDELAAALSRLLQDSIERQSRGRAAAQGAAKLASSLVGTVWSVLEDVVIAPALQQYISSGDNPRAPR